jgi:chemotaxis protein MotB
VAGGGGSGGALLEEEHEEHVNHEAWVIPYADMVTLLMALFLMLFAISTIDLAKFEKMASNLGVELRSGGSNVLEGGDGVLAADGDAPDVGIPPITPAEQALAREQARAKARQAEQESLDQVEQRIAAHAAAVGLADSVGFRREERGLVVTVVTDNVLFEPGSADLRPEGLGVLREVAVALVDLPNQVAVEGHTDDRPIATPRFPSNWELSTSRATSVLRYLVGTMGLDPGRVSAAGYGEQRPVASNGDPSGRGANRRVEVAVLARVPSA